MKQDSDCGFFSRYDYSICLERLQKTAKKKKKELSVKLANSQNQKSNLEHSKYEEELMFN
jgi:hypothetical protein